MYNIPDAITVKGKSTWVTMQALESLFHYIEEKRRSLDPELVTEVVSDMSSGVMVVLISVCVFCFYIFYNEHGIL